MVVEAGVAELAYSAWKVGVVRKVRTGLRCRAAGGRSGALTLIGADLAACKGCEVSAATCFLAVESKSVTTALAEATCFLAACLGSCLLSARRQLAASACWESVVRFASVGLLECLGAVALCHCLCRQWRLERVAVAGLPLAAVVNGLLWWSGRQRWQVCPVGLAGLLWWVVRLGHACNRTYKGGWEVVDVLTEFLHEGLHCRRALR